jgi:hypothetical protein
MMPGIVNLVNGKASVTIAFHKLLFPMKPVGYGIPLVEIVWIKQQAPSLFRPGFNETV